MRRRLAALFFAFLVAAPAVAAAQQGEVRVWMEATPSRVPVGEILTLEIRAESEGASIDGVELPSLDGFEVIAREMSQPLRLHFGRGIREMRIASVHRLRLRALRPGTFELEPARVTSGTERYASNPVRIEVTGSNGVAPMAPPPGSPPITSDPSAPTALDGAVFDPELFLRTVVDKTDPYVGEQVTVTVYLYSTLSGQSQLTREPSTDGFWVHDLLGNRQSRPERQLVHGIPFRVLLVRRMAVFPLRSGELVIGAPEARFEQNVFGFLRGPAVLERRGVPITLNVRPLPPPAPAGAVVGRYTIDASVDRTSAAVGDAITLSVVVRGTGNLDDVRIAPPSIPGVRVLPPEIDDQITTDADLLGGTRTVRFLLLPEQPGTITLPPIRLPYFDPHSEQYGAAETAPIRLTITGTPVAPTAPSPADAASEGPRADEADDARDEPLRFGPVRPRAELRRASLPVSAAPWYRWALAAPPLLWILVLVGGTAVTRARQRSSRAATDGHLRDARKRLRAAEAHKREGDARRFYAEVSGALVQALEGQLAGVAGLTHGELRKALEARGMADDLTARIIEELESCDFARFSAAGASAEEMERCRQRVEALLDRLGAFRPTPPSAEVAAR